jgi:hypothetical protein
MRGHVGAMVRGRDDGVDSAVGTAEACFKVAMGRPMLLPVPYQW